MMADSPILNPDDNDEVLGAWDAAPPFIKPLPDNKLDDAYDEILNTLPTPPTMVKEKPEGPPVEVLKPFADPVTPTEIHLTPRQQRVLHYLARRRMRNVRISKRPAYDDSSITNEEPPSEMGSVDLPLPDEESGHHELDVPAKEIPSLAATHTVHTPIPDLPPLEALVPTAEPTTPIPESLIEIEGIRTLPLPPVPLPRTYLPQTKKRWRRQKVLRHLSRKHRRRARVREYRALRRLWLTMGSIFLSLLIIFLSLGSAAAVVAYRFYTQTHVKYEQKVLNLYELLPQDNLKMYDSKGVLLMQMADQGIHTSVPLDQVAPVMINATIATEDKNFWSNQGIDLLRILRAALDDLRRERVVEGGSTITQQLIKNLIVGNQTTFVRKLEEVTLTPEINSRYSKRDILQMYLNSIYYGHQAYGIDAAAMMYFGLEDKPNRPAAMQLDLAQAAMLAGIPSNPSAFDPLLHPKAAFNRFETVLGLMVGQGYITKVDALDAIKEANSLHFFKIASSLRNRAPHYADFVLSQLMQLFHLKDRSQLSRSGMIVYTTLDIALQDKIQKIAQRHIAELRNGHNLTNAAEVLIDYHTGAIISLLGSIDYNNKAIDGQFDVVTQGYRQPGSSFKPYVYVTAFKQGASPGQAVADVPTTIDNPGGDPSLYSPTNYDLHFHGHMTLRCALQNSLNVPAVRVLRRVGIDESMETAKEMGITKYQGTPGYSLVLGGLGIRLIDHTSAMGTFANGGVHVGYYAVNKVISASTNKVIYEHGRASGKRVISPQLAYMMTSVLSDNTSRIPEFYDCNVLQLYSNSQDDCWNGNRGVVRPAAVKTGTTQNFRDNWTVGYTTDFVMGVWAGNDDNSPMFDVTGVQGAAPIWHDSMLLAEQGHPIRDFVNPGGLVQATVTYADGVKTTDWFLPGTVPVSVQPTPTPNPTPTPTAVPTQTTTGNLSLPFTLSLEPTPLPTPKPTPTPEPGSGTPPLVTPHAYCPNDYSFAFAPPSYDTEEGNGWW